MLQIKMKPRWVEIESTVRDFSGVNYDVIKNE